VRPHIGWKLRILTRSCATLETKSMKEWTRRKPSYVEWSHKAIRIVTRESKLEVSCSVVKHLLCDFEPWTKPTNLDKINCRATPNHTRAPAFHAALVLQSEWKTKPSNWDDWHVENIHPNSGTLNLNIFRSIFKIIQEHARLCKNKTCKSSDRQTDG